MEKNNDVCGVGVAYNSRITGVTYCFKTMDCTYNSAYLLGILLVVASGQTDIAESRALSHKDDLIAIYSNSWGPADNGFSVGRLSTLVERTFEQGAQSVRPTYHNITTHQQLPNPRKQTDKRGDPHSAVLLFISWFGSIFVQ